MTDSQIRTGVRETFRIQIKVVMFSIMTGGKWQDIETDFSVYLI